MFGGGPQIVIVRTAAESYNGETSLVGSDSKDKW